MSTPPLGATALIRAISIRASEPCRIRSVCPASTHAGATCVVLEGLPMPLVVFAVSRQDLLGFLLRGIGTYPHWRLALAREPVHHPCSASLQFLIHILHHMLSLFHPCRIECFPNAARFRTRSLSFPSCLCRSSRNTHASFPQENDCIGLLRTQSSIDSSQ